MQVKYVKDYYESIQKKFPDVPLADIKRILNFGFKSLYLSNVYGGDVHIQDNNLWLYIGNLTKDSIKHFENYKRKLVIKLKVLNKRLKRPWDGYYYFGIPEKQQLQIESSKNKKGRPKKHFNYGTVILYQYLNECEIQESDKQFIYRVPFVSNIGNKLFMENFTSDKAELIIKRNPLKLTDLIEYGRQNCNKHL